MVAVVCLFYCKALGGTAEGSCLPCLSFIEEFGWKGVACLGMRNCYRCRPVQESLLNTVQIGSGADARSRLFSRVQSAKLLKDEGCCSPELVALYEVIDYHGLSLLV